MKVTESENECDFCGAKYPHLHAINDGAWAICKPCMDIHYTTLPAIEKKKQSPQGTIASDRYNIYGEEE